MKEAIIVLLGDTVSKVSVKLDHKPLMSLVLPCITTHPSALCFLKDVCLALCQLHQAMTLKLSYPNPKARDHHQSHGKVMGFPPLLFSQSWSHNLLSASRWLNSTKCGGHWRKRLCSEWKPWRNLRLGRLALKPISNERRCPPVMVTGLGSRGCHPPRNAPKPNIVPTLLKLSLVQQTEQFYQLQNTSCRCQKRKTNWL